MQASIVESWDVPEAGNTRWLVHVLPSLTDFSFLLPLVLLFFFLPGARFLLSDGGTGWHIRTGEWIIQNRAVPRTDLFSFTKPHAAWFAWEWGADVILASIHKAAGLAGIAFFTALLLGVISALLFRLIRRTSGNDVLAFGFTILAMCGSMIHWLARPHLFTWLFALVFSHVILTVEEGNKKPLLWLPLAMLAWTNLHGGFFIGIALLLTSAAGALVPALKGDRAIAVGALKAALPYFYCACACCAVTLLNPYGWRLHEHIAAYLRDSKLLNNIQEYQSVDFHQPAAMFFECMLLPGIAASFWCLRLGKYAAAFTVLLWAHLALESARNLPLFVLLAAPWVASMSQQALAHVNTVRWLRGIHRVLAEMAVELRSFECIERWHIVSGLAVIALASCFAANRPGFEGCFNAKNFPVSAIPALTAAHTSRLFTSDQWADYLIYEFFPSERVFMDDRSDFYGYGLLNDYQHIMSAQYDWDADLKKFSIDAVLVKPDAPIAAVLKQSAHWRMLFDDGSAILFQTKEQSSGTGDFTPAMRRPAPGCELQSVIENSRTNDFGSIPKTNERRSL